MNPNQKPEPIGVRIVAVNASPIAKTVPVINLGRMRLNPAPHMPYHTQED